MNVYSQLWELLRPTGAAGESAVCFGQISGIQPPAVTLAGQVVSALWPRGTALTEADLGREVAMLPLPEGFLVLFQVEGGNT